MIKGIYKNTTNRVLERRQYYTYYSQSQIIHVEYKGIYKVAILLFNLLPSFRISSYTTRVTAVKAGIDLHIHNLFLMVHASWI